MSTPPEKPLPHPPLHNFALPELNWSKNHSTNLHRGRRLGESSSQTQSSSMNSAILRFQDSLSLQQHDSPTAANVRSQLPHRSDSRRGRPRERKEESDRSQFSPGFQLRMRKKAEVVAVEDKEKDMADEDEEEKKSWNFRPRKPLQRPVSGNPSIYSYDPNATVAEGISDFPPIAGSSSGMKSTPAKPQKPIFSLTLTPEEIEEDIFAMTGSKPSRKPKRRPKAVQKQLDNLFPGMWLGSVTPDSYKVPDPSKKK